MVISMKFRPRLQGVNCVYYELKSSIFVEIDVLLTSGSNK